jgi:hypothetical protein
MENLGQQQMQESSQELAAGTEMDQQLSQLADEILTAMGKQAIDDAPTPTYSNGKLVAINGYPPWEFALWVMLNSDQPSEENYWQGSFDPPPKLPEGVTTGFQWVFQPIEKELVKLYKDYPGDYPPSYFPCP